jgi:hypothetical protein
MNEEEFKRHLKDLVHGHHHPEEHDWNGQPAGTRKRAGGRAAAAKPLTSSKTGKKK